MERGRVVYYAKTKTSKVLTPSSTKRQQGLSSSAVDSEPQAPLAAGESDILAPARSRSHMSDHRGDIPRKTWRRENDEQNSNLPLASFVQDVHLNESSKVDRQSVTPLIDQGALQKRDDLNTSPTERRIVQGPVLTAPTGIKEQKQNKKIQKPGSVKIAKNGEAKAKITAGVQAKRKNSSQEFIHDFQAVTTVTRNTGGYTKQTVITNMPPSLMFQNDSVFPTMYIGNGPTLDSSLSITDLSSQDPTMPLQNARDKKQQSVTKPMDSNKTISSAMRNESPVSSVNGNNIVGGTPCNNSTETVVTSDQTSTMLEWTIDENNAIICRKVSIKSNTRPYIEALNKSNSSSDSKYESICSGSFPNLISNNKFDPKFSSHERNYFDPNSSIGGNDRLHLQSASSEQISHNCGDNNLLNVNSQSVSNLESADPTSPRMRMKRNSLRLATQGFVSMSDLTDSIECLQLVSREDDTAQAEAHKSEGENDNDSSSSSDEYLDAVLEHDNTENNGNVLSGDVLYSSNGQIFTFFEQLDAMKPKLESKVGDDGDHTRKLTGQEGTSGASVQANALSCTGISIPVQNESRLLRNNVNRPSYKLATASTTDLNLTIGISRDDVDGPVPIPSSDVNYRNCPEKSSFPLHASDRADCEENNDNGTLKRRSYILATMESLTDLPCEVEKTDVVDSSPLSKRSVRTGSVRAESFNSGKSRSPPFFARRISVSSSQLNSSFGSFYSCQSLDFAKTKHSPKGERHSEGLIKDEIPASRFRLREGSNDMSSLDGSESANTSLYYSASDTSFRTPDNNGSQRPRADSTSSRRSPLFWRKPATSLSDNLLKTSNKRPAKINSHNHIPLGKGQRSLKRLNTVFQCYGCGFDYGHPAMSQRKDNRGRRVNSEKTSFAPTPSLPVSKPIARLYDNRTRCNTVPSTGDRGRHLELQILDRSDTFANGMGLDVSPLSPCSIDSDSDEWESTPRSPPALGRPKRKVYAGFDSQPLPMDSFMSDSSSVYTDCGSWSSRATSRSAEMEKSYHERGSVENLSLNMRSVSAMAPGTATPTRQMSQETLLDFLRYGDKQTAVGENNHNVYVSRGNSHANDKAKDTFEGKTFSNESLNSNLSTVTTTSLHHHGDIDTGHNEDVTKLPAEYLLQNNYKKNNGEKRINELPQDRDAQDRKSWAFDFRFRDSHEFLSNAWDEDSTKQHRPLKGSSSATIPKSKFQPKRRYFSTKDILDLLMTSERKVSSRSVSATSLEKQAQKMCRVILCCNEMEGPIPGRQFHY